MRLSVLAMVTAGLLPVHKSVHKSQPPVDSGEQLLGFPPNRKSYPSLSRLIQGLSTGLSPWFCTRQVHAAKRFFGLIPSFASPLLITTTKEI